MKVYLVGAGPGDPGLLTLKGRDVLARADVIVYDALANAGLLAFAKPGAELVYVGKVAGSHALPQDKINELLVLKARANGGQSVARLKGGDPYIFGRGGEEAEFLLDNGIPFEEVPGISSAIAAPAYAGIPLTHRGFTSSVCIITGHEDPEKTESSHNWRALAQSGSTLVFLMGMKNLAAIVQKLLEGGMAPDTPAALVYRGATPMQRTLVATLARLPDRAAAEKFSNPSVIVIGKVALLHERLAWFEARPLLGKNIVVTRAREQASDLALALENLGARVLQCPSIEIFPLADYSALDAAIASLPEYAWLVFTSVNGVKYFWQRLAAAGKDSRALACARVAAIGPATAGALAGKGVQADLLPETYVAEGVVKALLDREGASIAGGRVLLPRAAEARNVLPDELARAGAIVDVVPAYETRPAFSGKAEVLGLLADGRLDCVTFGSSSTVENFFAMIPADAIRGCPKTALAAIGPVTAKTLEKFGLKARISPAEYTIPGLVKAIEAFYSQSGHDGLAGGS